MYLKRLEIHGFKSFANKTVLEFSKGVIAVVGPNGSGKSNVADCLRWVLGEQSAKMIRGKKSDDVIFAGSDKKGKMGFAEVFATFDNTDRKIPLDASEVSIGRRIDRSGESEYLINNQKVRLLDVVDLVLKSNIGTSRYTVIGQGTIDQMILAGPPEVKNMVDEASGVKIYNLRREKTLRRLETTAQNLMRAEDLIAEIEPRLKSLRRQAKKMEARAEIEQELKVLQRQFFGKNFWAIKKQQDALLTDSSGFVFQKEQLEKEIGALRSEAMSLEGGEGENLDGFQSIREELSVLQKKKNLFLENLSLIRGKIQGHKTGGAGDPKVLQIELSRVETKLSELAESERELAGQRSEKGKKMEGIQNTLKEIELAIRKFSEKLNQPHPAFWPEMETEAEELENLVKGFFEKLEKNSPWEELRAVLAGFRPKFFSFIKSIRASKGYEPGNQKQLPELLSQRDAVATELEKVKIEFSKVEISLQFTEKQKQELENEKKHLEIELKKTASGSLEDFLMGILEEEKALQKQIVDISGEISKLESLFQAQREEELKKQKDLREVETVLRGRQDALNALKDRLNTYEVEKAKLDTQMQVLQEEVVRILGPEVWSVMGESEPAVLEDGAVEKIAKLKNQLDMIGGMDELTLKEYEETEERYTRLSAQVEDLKHSMDDLRKIMDELDEHIKEKFNKSFELINEKFEHFFRILFNGGRAYLSLVKDEAPEALSEVEGEEAVLEEDATMGQENSLRPEEKLVQKYEKGGFNVSGIDIKATPPGKKLANIQALSGGERSLTSIALLCSLLTCFPSPFVVLDEVDAALDDANTIRFGQILGSLSHQTQFLTITHNRETMAQASMLYGVTMGDDGVSKLLSVKLEQAKQFAK